MAEKKFVIDYPDIMMEWDWERNSQAHILPQSTTIGSDKKVFWICKNGHRWQASVRPRFVDKTKCPYCSGKRPVVGKTDLLTTHPTLCLEWDGEKNNNLRPTDVSKGSTKKVWWRCSEGHNWQATIGSRVAGNGCPYCSNNKLLIGYNDLFTCNPEVASEWHPTKNGSFTPTDFINGSGKKVWWMCKKCNFEWQTAIVARTKPNATGCPECAKTFAKIPTLEKSLLIVNPMLSKEWHPTKNGNLSPNNVFPSYRQKVWWKCSEGHEWEASVASRHRGIGCPICKRIENSRKRSTASYEESLLCLNPTLASEWNYKKNEDLAPEFVYPNSSKKVWWKCAIGHEWQASISSRNRGNGCPLCKKELQTSFPEQTIFFYIKKVFFDAINRYTENNKELDIFIPSLKVGIEYDGMRYHTQNTRTKEDKKDSYFNERGITVVRVKETKGNSEKVEQIENIFYYSPAKNYKYLKSTIISIFSHIAQLTNTIINNTDISIERDTTQIMQSYLSMLRESSISTNSILIKEWHYDKNNGLNPNYVSIGSGKKVWWICDKGHEWQAVVSSRANGNNCPYCSNQKILVGYNDLASLNPKLSKEWHPTKNGELMPNQVSAGTSKKVWWICSKGHEWQANINTRSKGVGCPYCTNQRVVSGENDLETKNPVLAKEWHSSKNGSLLPSMVTSGSGKKVWWICPKGHEWQAFINHRSKGIGCPICYKESLKKTTNKKINVYSAQDLSFYGVFEDAKSFCEHFNLDYNKKKSQITAVCKRRQKTLLGKFIVRYEKDDEFKKGTQV